MNGREMERTNGRQKVRLVAGFLLGLAALQICWDVLAGLGKPQPLTLLVMKAVFASVVASLLMHRSSWARHVVGVLMAMVVPVNLLFIALYPEYRSLLFSAGGLLHLVGIAFAGWTAWTLLFDPEVIEWFHAGDPEER